MASSGVNVLRWSALGVGIFYGFYHNQSIKARDAHAKAQSEWQQKESLISQAKAEWAKSNPTEAPKPSTSTPKADPKDPNADYLAVLGIEDK